MDVFLLMMLYLLQKYQILVLNASYFQIYPTYTLKQVDKKKLIRRNCNNKAGGVTKHIMVSGLHDVICFTLSGFRQAPSTIQL